MQLGRHRVLGLLDAVGLHEEPIRLGLAAALGRCEFGVQGLNLALTDVRHGLGLGAELLGLG